MKERDEFENFIQQNMEGYSVVPETSVWNEVNKEISQKGNGQQFYWALAAMLLIIIFIWYYNRFFISDLPHTDTNEQILFAQDDIQRGEKLFTSNCTSCHNMEKVSPENIQIIGSLIEKKGKDWFLDFMKNGHQMPCEDFLEIQNNNLDGHDHHTSSMNPCQELDMQEILCIFSYANQVYFNESPKKDEEFIWAHDTLNTVHENGNTFEVPLQGQIDSMDINGNLHHDEAVESENLDWQ